MRSYDADAIRKEIAEAEIEAVIPARATGASSSRTTKDSYLGFVAIAAVKLRMIPFVHAT